MLYPTHKILLRFNPSFHKTLNRLWEIQIWIFWFCTQIQIQKFWPLLPGYCFFPIQNYSAQKNCLKVFLWICLFQNF